MNKKRELHYIDIAKGIAIFLVVLGHVYMTEDTCNRWIYSFHVPVFFIITGMLMEHSNGWKKKKLTENILIEAKRLLYPYAVFCILAYAYIVYVYFFEPGRVAYKRLYTTVFDILILEGTSALWFLPAIFYAKIIHIITYRSRIFNTIMAVMAAAVTYIISVYIKTVDTSQMISAYKVKVIIVAGHSLCGFIFLVIGRYLYYFFEKVYAELNYIIKFMAVIVLIFANIMMQQKSGMVDVHMCVFPDFIRFYIGAVTGSMALLSACNMIGRLRIAEYYGRDSLIVMATHKPLPVLYYSIKLFNYTQNQLKDYIIGIEYRSVTGRIIIAIITMLLEILCIEMINRWLTLLVRYPKRKK